MTGRKWTEISDKFNNNMKGQKGITSIVKAFIWMLDRSVFTNPH